jgi:hypothetical protein
MAEGRLNGTVLKGGTDAQLYPRSLHAILRKLAEDMAGLAMLHRRHISLY